MVNRQYERADPGFMKRKYFFFDIDDTLLVHGQNWDGDYVPDSTKEALRLLEENGHLRQ